MDLLAGNDGSELTTLRMVGLTCGVGGIQIIWAVLMGSTSLRLKALGFSNAELAMIWLMGPLAGTFIQPLMGFWSHAVTCRWGRRVPFVVGGAVGVVTGLIVLSGVRELARLGAFSSRVVAIIGVCMVFLFAQPLQMGARALIAEQSPSKFVSQTNGWASRWVGLGSVVGYLLGAFNRGESGTSLYVTAASLLILSTIITCCNVREAPLLEKTGPIFASGPISPAIRQVFKVQFLAWMAWFPFLYYGSTYITEGRLASIEASTFSRGSFGMFLFALVALGFSTTLPPLLARFDISRRFKRRRPLVNLWMMGHLSYSVLMLCAAVVQGGGRVVLVVLAGFSWSTTQWAPFTLINKYLLDDELDAGIVMSLHNVAVSLPQILAALLTGGVLWGFRVFGVANELGILLSLTAVPGLLAAYQAGCIED